MEDIEASSITIPFPHGILNGLGTFLIFYSGALPALLGFFEARRVLDGVGTLYLESVRRSSQFSFEFPCLFPQNSLFSLELGSI